MTTGATGRDFGGYRLLHELGRGGMGTVHVAMQRNLQRPVALKVLSANAGSERAMWRFQREAQLLAQLEHPGIVKVIESGLHDRVPFFAMELVAGASLADVLHALAAAGEAHRGGEAIRQVVQLRAAAIEPTTAACEWSLPVDSVAAMVTIVAEVATALASAHAAGVVHRDVKPSNILIRRDGAVRIADFGVAHRADAAAMTATGDFAGTPSYMAPEQLRGDAVDHRVDVFALGVVLHEALTLKLPFAGTTVAARLAAGDTPPVPADRQVPSLGRDLVAVIGVALAASAGDRYQTAGELAADLRAVLAGAPVRARRPGRAEALWRRARQRPWLLATLLLASAAVTTASGFDQWGRRQVRAEGERVAAALGEVQRLTVGVRIDAAVAAANAFLVARVEDVPAMDRWLAEHGAPLAAELPGFERMLRQLREEALPYGEAEFAADAADHPARLTLARIDEELAFLDESLAREPGLAVAATRRPLVLEARSRQIELLQSARRWRLPNAERQFLHDQVATIVTRLRALTVGTHATVARIATQREWALASHRRCVVDAAASWRQVADDVVADPRFGGLRLRPQRDLLPLAKDPHSGLWEFVHLRSGTPGREVPERRNDGTLQPGVDMGIVFVLLPGGSYAMGAQSRDASAENHDPQALGAEEPVARVTVAPFFCGKFEVTIAQWSRLVIGIDAEFAASDELTRLDRTPTEPVHTVSQPRALRVMADHGLWLPSEAQWEYACRAGTKTPFPFGRREEAPRYANFADAQARKRNTATPDDDLDDGFAQAAPVGSFAANQFGLHDTLGNIGELVDGRINVLLSNAFPGFDARQPRYDDPGCMSRGGSWRSPLTLLRASSRRDAIFPDQSQPDTGLRAVRAIEP